MAWRIAESLEVLRKQLNAAFPKRSKASDGGIGDAKHASRSSDHNPHIKDGSMGVVTARDFTHDPKTGIDCHWLADTLVRNKDPRIKYIIWNRQICSSKNSPWKWRKYTGVNAHTKHLHVSVDADKKLYDSTKPWKLDYPKPVPDENDIAEVSESDPLEQTPAEHLQNEPGSSEVTAKKETDTPTGTETLTVTAKNEQDVNELVKQDGPKPYNEVGLKDTLVSDAKAVLPANGIAQTASEVTQHVQGLPEWAAPLVVKLALFLLVVSVGWALYRVIAWLVHNWRENEKQKLTALINTDINRKNIEFK